MMLPRCHGDCEGQLGQASADTELRGHKSFSRLARHSSRQHEITVRSLNFGPRASDAQRWGQARECYSIAAYPALHEPPHLPCLWRGPKAQKPSLQPSYTHLRKFEGLDTSIPGQRLHRLSLCCHQAASRNEIVAPWISIANPAFFCQGSAYKAYEVGV